MTWTREHDALIARVAEQRTVLGPDYRTVKEPHWLHHSGDYYDWIPNYLTDLTAIARAVEAWKQQSPKLRWWGIRRESVIHGWCRQGKTESMWGEAHVYGEHVGETVAEAMAWALWRACGGVE